MKLPVWEYSPSSQCVLGAIHTAQVLVMHKEADVTVLSTTTRLASCYYVLLPACRAAQHAYDGKQGQEGHEVQTSMDLM